jgi:FkbM family methyltransferase
MQHDRKTYILEPHPLTFEFRLLCRKNDELVIFDVGSCEGEDSVRFSRLFPRSKIFAFEPIPDNFILLEENFKLYDISNAHAFNIAVSDGVSELSMYVSKVKYDSMNAGDWDYGNKSSSLLKPHSHVDLVDFIYFPTEIKVKTTTLKEVLDQNNLSKIDVLQLDVQGAELLVLKGLANRISDVKLIWLEVSSVELYRNQPLAKDIDDYLLANGFYLLKDDSTGISGDRLYASKSSISSFRLKILRIVIIIHQLYSNYKYKIVRRLKRLFSA